MKDNHNTHGGARPGAGRKPGRKKFSATISIRVPMNTYDDYKRLRADGVNIAEEFKSLIGRLAKL